MRISWDVLLKRQSSVGSHNFNSKFAISVEFLVIVHDVNVHIMNAWGKLCRQLSSKFAACIWIA